MPGRLVRHREVIAPYRRTVVLRSDLAVAWPRLGLARWALGAKKETIESFERALAADPRLEEAAASLGRTAGP